MTRLFLAFILFASSALADPSIQVAFSPHAGATAAVVQLIGEAQKSIHLAGYGFTSKPIAEALIQAHAKGVDVDAVLDKSNETARYSEATELAAAGIPVRIDSNYATRQKGTRTVSHASHYAESVCVPFSLLTRPLFTPHPATAAATVWTMARSSCWGRGLTML